MSDRQPQPEHISLDDLIEAIERCTCRPGPNVNSCDDCPACRVDAAVARGAVLAIPTESSYGLAVDPANQAAVERVFEIKGRADTAPLLVVVGHAAQLSDLGLDLGHPLARRASAEWPAPLTVVLPSPRDLPAQRGFPTLAVRVPEHPALRRVLDRTGPLTATSANRSGEDAIFDPSRLDELFAGVDAVVIDAGRLEPAAPSTLLAWNDETSAEVVLRQGAWRP